MITLRGENSDLSRQEQLLKKDILCIKKKKKTPYGAPKEKVQEQGVPLGHWD